LVLAHVLAAILNPLASVGSAQQAPVRLSVPRTAQVSLELNEILRIGSSEGRDDSFGRIMSATFDSGGRIIVADDFNTRISVFSPAGRLIGAFGRRGSGPGEFQQPWFVAAGPGDSIYVWDAALARIQVFDREFRYGRVFRIPPHWVVNGIEFLPEGKLLISAYGAGERRGLHILDAADGKPERSVGPVFEQRPELTGFEASLMGGALTAWNEGFVYSTKSPYGIYFINRSGDILRHCAGEPGWTSDPASVVVRDARGAGLLWNRYVHSAAVLALGEGRFLNVVVDPASDRRVLDVVDSACRMLTRRVIHAPLLPIRMHGDRLLAVRTLDYPELVVFALQWRR
jgi:hypothetical protein